MTDSSAILYVLLLAIVFLFWRKVHGRSIDDLLEQGLRDHHHVHGVIAKYPRGGTWKEHEKWMGEEE